MNTFVCKQNIWIAVWFLLPVFNFRDLDDSNGINNFQQYYACYFDKYFQPKYPSSGMREKREEFVSKLLREALVAESLAPSTSCVQWMCDPRLVWKIWTVGTTKIWSYYSDIGNTILSWKGCFGDRETELGNYGRIISGLIYQLYTTLLQQE